MFEAKFLEMKLFEGKDLRKPTLGIVQVENIVLMCYPRYRNLPRNETYPRQ